MDFSNAPDYYDDYGDYDAYEHMTSDPVDYAMYGYGGFGYDTSHVAAPEDHSQLYKLAEKGDLKGITDLVEEAQDPDDRAKLVNHARKWTEVDYRASGFTKEHEWFDLTPVSVAARHGHTDVLKYLLEKHADPTLNGCYTEDAYATTKYAAKLYLEQQNRQVSTYRTQTASPRLSITLKGQTAEEKAADIYLSFKRAKYNLVLVEEALKFWNTAPYTHARYSSGDRKFFTNKPKKGLREALQEVKIPVLGDDPKDVNEVALIAKTIQRCN